MEESLALLPGYLVTPLMDGIESIIASFSHSRKEGNCSHLMTYNLHLHKPFNLLVIGRLFSGVTPGQEDHRRVGVEAVVELDLVLSTRSHCNI